MVDTFLYKEESYQIIGALYYVYNELGSGLKESTYQRAVAAALRQRLMKFQEQYYQPLRFHNEVVGSYYFDFLIDEKIILELKVGEYFARQNIDQVNGYLKSMNLQLAILANFTRTGVKIKRVVNII